MTGLLTLNLQFFGGRGTSSGTGSYTEFTDEPDSGFTYSGNDDDEVAFFKKNSNYEELLKEIAVDGEATDAFLSWARGYWMSGEMYYGFDNLTDHQKRLVETYDKYLDNATLKKSIVLTRLSDAQLVLGGGKIKGTLKELQAAEGQRIVCPANMSFAAAKHGLVIGAKGKAGKTVEYRLHIKGGEKSTGVGMWIGDRDINDWGGKQREFMTNRDIGLRVGKTTYDKKRRKYITDIYYEGLMDHDYGKDGPIPLF